MSPRKDWRMFPSGKRERHKPAISFREFAHKVGLNLNMLTRIANTQTRVGNPPPKPVAKNSNTNDKYYRPEDLLAWWRKVKGKDPLTCKTIDSSDPACSNAENNQGETKMPDLKSELTKVINQWTDEDKTPQAPKSYKERVFDWLKANPSSTAAEVREALAIADPDMPGDGIAQTLYALVDCGLAAKVPFLNHVHPFGQRTNYRYHTIVDTYPTHRSGVGRPYGSPNKPKAKPKAAPKKGDAGLASLFAINKSEGAQGNSHGNSQGKVAPSKPSIESYLDTLSVNEAYQLYQRLKDMFDAK